MHFSNRTALANHLSFDSPKRALGLFLADSPESGDGSLAAAVDVLNETELARKCAQLKAGQGRWRRQVPTHRQMGVLSPAVQIVLQDLSNEEAKAVMFDSDDEFTPEAVSAVLEASATGQHERLGG